LRSAIIETTKLLAALVLAALLVAAPGCLVRRVTHVHAPGRTAPVMEASLAELVAKIQARSRAIHTMSATVDLEPTAGSIYSGVIKEYHDVKGFILLEEPSTIRLLGQAPVVRTNVFDMVSNGEEFRLYIPAKQKFIVGKNAFRRPAKNSLENLRPQHILQALIVPPIDTDHETTYRTNPISRTQPRRYYVVNIVEPQSSKHMIPRRQVWFDRADLELVRTQFFEPDGTCTEDVRYSAYQDFEGVHYPAHIEINRPEEDYQVTITIEKAVFNQPIALDKFELKKPDGAELVDLSAAKPEEKRGQ
jgi:hypothetical protein